MTKSVGKKMAWLAGVSAIALAVYGAEPLRAQTPNLPPVTIDAPSRQQVRRSAPPRRTIQSRSTTRRVTTSTRPQPVQPTTGPGAQTVERANGPVVGYSARVSGTGTKTDTPLLETPQSISVVTKDQIIDQQAQSIVEALRYTPGVSLDAYSANTFFDSVKIRGFDAPRYLDGLRLPLDPNTQFAVPRIETYGLERIEVLKGPASGLYGQTDPGGILNMISKRPTLTPHFEAEAQFGSFNRVQGAFDIGGPLDRNGEFLYRVVGLGRSSDTQIDFQQDNKLFIAPSLTWRPTNDTSFTVLAQYQNIDNKGFQQYVPGIGSLLFNPNGRIAYSRYLGEPSVDGYKLEQGAIGYAFEHRFTNNIQFRQNFRYTDVSNDLTGVRSEGFQPDLRTLNRSVNYVLSDSRNVALDNQLQVDARTGPFVHKVLFGVDYLKIKSNSDYRFAFISPIDAYAPVYGAPVPSRESLAPFIKTSVSQEQVGVYLQDQIKLDRWTLTLTGRHDWASAETVSTGLFPAPGTTRQNDSATTGRVALNYLFDAGISPYVSYTTSFQPISGVDAAGNAFRPTTGESKEVGIKYNPLGTNLLLTAALFEIVQQNVTTAAPGNPFLSVQTGEVRLRGFEVEARGNVTRELQIIGGYGHLSPVVTQSNDGFIGNFLPQVALEQASLWAKYTWYNGHVAGLGIGAGVRYVGESFGDAANTIRIPSYALFDAAVSYDFRYLRPDLKGWTAQFNATNIGNRYYVSSCSTSLSYCGLGQARRVLGTLRYAWN